MNNAYSAYSQRQRKEETVRETEAHALLNCASRLEAAREDGTPRDEYFAALRHNQELWTVFQAALCEADNPLPREIKVLLLNLSRYVDKTTFRAIAEGNRDLLRSLISINRNIAGGLQKKLDSERAAATMTPSATATSYGATSGTTSDADRPASLMTSA